MSKVKKLDSQVLKYFKQHNIGPATRSIISNLTKINNDETYNLKSRAAAWDNPLYFWQMVAACRWLGYTKRFRYEKAVGRNYSVLEIEMQAIACPGFVQTLPSGGIEFQEQRQMLPILGVFPFYGRKNDHAAQASFQAELLLEMRPRAREIYERGGIYLNNETLAELAVKANMPEKLIKPVLELWVKENYLEQTKDNLYNLGTRELGARQMLIQAGKFEFEGSVAGKTNLKKRRKKLSGKKVEIS